MDADTILSADALRALWKELGQDETLDEKYELTEHGELVMSAPATNRHQALCTLIAMQLQQRLGGTAIVEAAVLTPDAGVRVPDVSWTPAPAGIANATLLERPDLVVEVLSPGNRRTEIAHKVRAYLAGGVREVIVVALDGTIRYHRADGAHAESALGVRLELPSELFG